MNTLSSIVKTKNVTLGLKDITVLDLVEVARYDAKVVLSQVYCDRVTHPRELTEHFIAENRLNLRCNNRVRK